MRLLPFDDPPGARGGEGSDRSAGNGVGRGKANRPGRASRPEPQAKAKAAVQEDLLRGLDRSEPREPRPAPAQRLRHPALAAALRTGAFEEDGGDFAAFEAKLTALSSDPATTSKLVGDAFEVFAGALLLTDPRAEAEEVWPLAAAPHAVLDALNIGRGDRGCDGVCRRRDGALVAYQVRFRSSRRPLTWTALSTFVGWSEAAPRRLVVTNADAVADEAMSRRGVMAIRGGDLDRLGAARMSRIKALVRGQHREFPKREPRPHQAAAVADIVAALSRADRATAVMACGTGKTLVSMWVAHGLEAGAVLVLLPSLALVRQTLEEWAEQHRWGGRFRFLCVCSDETVADDALRICQSDVPFPITTGPERIRAFLAGHGDGAVRVVFSTYHSAERVAEGVPPGFRFGLGVFDEAHATAGHDGAPFAFALEDARLPIRKRLFLTATPRVHSVRGRSGAAALVHSMDDEAVYGRVAHRLSFGRAAGQGIICRYKVLVAVVTRTEVARALRSSRTAVAGGALPSQDVAARVALARAVREHGLSKAITFHHSVEAARDFVDGAAGVGAHLPEGFGRFHVSGEMATAARDRVLRDFGAAARACVSNARCLTEGVDVPAVDLVGFMARKRSKVDIVQAIGRALRRAPGKAFGHVLMPLFLDEEAGESVEAAVERADFGPVWDVLRALMDQDEELVEAVDRLRRERARTGATDTGALDGFVEVLGGALPLDDLRRAIGVRVVDGLGEPFEAGFGHLQRFVERTGHARVPVEHTEDGYPLGSWIHARRQEHRRGALGAGRAARLADLPGWSWGPQAESLDRGFAHLLAFREREGHCLVPAKHKEDGYDLGSWVTNRRQDRRKGKLSPEEIARFDAVDGWSWAPRADHDAEGFALLRAQVAREGHARVPQKHFADGFNLGLWADRKRQTYRKGTLPPCEAARLAALPGWSWTPKAEAFEAGFAHLLRYAAREGHASVPGGHREGSFELGAWVGVVRQQKRIGNLAPARVAKLEALPGWSWKPKADRRDRSFALLRQFVRREGHARVPSGHMEGPFPLGSWCGKLRARHSEGVLSPDTVRRLEALPGWEWNLKAARFADAFALLERFAAREGHTRVPQPHREDGYGLGAWAAGLRRDYRRGKLSAGTIARLEAFQGWTWDPDASDTEEALAMLRAYVAREGHARVPQSHREGGVKLGIWVSTKRDQYRKGRLAPEMVAALEALPGWSWDTRAGAFEESFGHLEAYVAREGHARVPAGHREGPFRLGRWLHQLRQDRRRRKLAAERIARLESLPGWTWTPSADSFADGFAVLEAFVAREGHARVPVEHVEGGARLGRWAHKRRMARRRGRLDAGVAERLEALPGWTWHPKAGPRGPS